MNYWIASQNGYPDVSSACIINTQKNKNLDDVQVIASKTMKTTILKILASIFLVAVISACGDDSPKPEKENENGNGNSKSILADNSIFFFVVDGIRYDTNTKIQKILDDGYTLYNQAHMTREIDAGKYYDGYTTLEWGDDGSFSVYAINKTNKKLTIPECTLYKMSLYSIKNKKITIYGNLTFGSTIEEVEKVFVGETPRKTTRKQREEFASGGISNSETDVHISYHKPNSAFQGHFEFYFDDDGKLVHIIMESNM